MMLSLKILITCFIIKITVYMGYRQPINLMLYVCNVKRKLHRL